MSKVIKYLKENYILVIMFVTLSVIEIAFIFPIMYGDHIQYDSSYQYGLTLHSIPEIQKLIPEDYSPPFYALALKIYCMAFGYSLVTMRTFSIIAVVGMLFISAFPVNTLFGKRSAAFCVIITFCSQIMLNLIHEIRPTIFAMFFYMAAAVYAGVAYSTEKKYSFVCLAVFSILAMYTHYIALLGVFCIYVVLLLFSLVAKKRRKFLSFFITGGICGILYLPWLKIVLTQTSHVKNDNYYWVSNKSISDAIRWITTLLFKNNISEYSALGYTIEYFLKLLIAVFFVIMLIKHLNLKKIGASGCFKDIIKPIAEKNVYVNILLIVSFLLAVFAAMEIVFIFVRNIRTARYYFILSALWIVILSAAIGNFGNKFISIAVSVMLFINNAMNISHIIQDKNNANMTQIVDDINAISGNEEICFLHFHEATLGIASYYFPNATHYVFDDTATVLRDLSVFNTEVINIGNVDNIWDYTDKCYVFTNVFENFDYEKSAEEEFSRMNNNEIVYIKSYTMAYNVYYKDFGLAEVHYTGEKVQNNSEVSQ